MSYCTQCGHPAEPGRFCTNCGAQLADQWRPEPVEHTQTAVLPVAAIRAAVAAPPTEPAPAPAHVVAPTKPRFGLGGPRKVFLVLALLVACVVAWALGRAVGTGDSGPGGAPSVAAGDVVDLTRGATAAADHTAPPNQDLSGDMVPYDAHNLLDGVPSTAWRMAGDGSGDTLTVTLPSDSVVTRVGLINGYAKVDGGVDWYPRNRRVLEVEWLFDDGSSVVQHLDETSRLQTIDVGPVRTSTIRMRIMIVGPSGGRDYTAVSDLLIEGAAA